MKLRKIALGTLAIAAVILVATDPEVGQVRPQAANAAPVLLGAIEEVADEIVNKAKPLFGVDLPLGRESPVATVGVAVSASASNFHSSVDRGPTYSNKFVAGSVGCNTLVYVIHFHFSKFLGYDSDIL